MRLPSEPAHAASAAHVDAEAIADDLRAAVDVMALMGVAGEVAHAGARGPGTMPASFFDALHHFDHAELVRRLRLDVIRAVQ